MSSTRLDYKVDAIRQRIIARRDTAIEEAQAKLDADTTGLAGRRLDWRKESLTQLRRVIKINAELTDEQFKEAVELPSYPNGPSKYGDSPQETFVKAKKEAEDRHDRTIGRLEALRSHEVDGEAYLSMTPTMLKDWFGV